MLMLITDTQIMMLSKIDTPARITPLITTIAGLMAYSIVSLYWEGDSYNLCVAHSFTRLFIHFPTSITSHPS